MPKLPQGQLAFTAMVNLHPEGYPPDFTFRIFVTNLDGTNLKRIDHVGPGEHPATNASDPKWCANRRDIEYTISRYSESDRRYFSTLMLVSQEDGTEKQIGPVPEPDPIYYHWNSPDGKYAFLLWEHEDKMPGFALANPNGSNEQACADELFDVHHASWLPDSSAIWMKGSQGPERGARSSLYLYEMSSNKVVPLLEKSAYDDMTSWSPDLQFLITAGAAKTREYGDGFYLISRDGSFCKHLADHHDESGEIRSSMPSWSPDGQYFAISALLSEESFDFSLLLFDRHGELLSALCWPNEHFARIDDMALNVYL